MRVAAIGAGFALLAASLAGAFDGRAVEVAHPAVTAASRLPPADPIPSMVGRTGSAPAPAGDPTVLARASIPLRRFSVLVSGDVLLHESLWAQAQRDSAAKGEGGYDFRPMLAGVRPAVSAADLAVCHLETPLGPQRGPFTGYPIFSVPPRIAQDLAWVGYDACTTASNHTVDRGVDGVTRTLDALDAAGIEHAGSARTAREAATVTLLRAGGARVALLSYMYGLNGLPKPAGRPWIVTLIDPDRIKADARRARAKGAEVVLVALHWGNEYQHRPSDAQRELAASLLADQDIDLVYGHHAHVVQPFERIGGEWVAYSLGNHIGAQAIVDRATHQGVMARFEFTASGGGRWRVTRVEHLPTALSYVRPYRLVDLSRMLADDRVSGTRRRAYQILFDQISSVVNDLGADQDGLVAVEQAR